jgi:hypothetical protein
VVEGEVESVETEIDDGRETRRDGGREHESNCERVQRERWQSKSSASTRAYVRGISDKDFGEKNRMQ